MQVQIIKRGICIDEASASSLHHSVADAPKRGKDRYDEEKPELIPVRRDIELQRELWVGFEDDFDERDDERARFYILRLWFSRAAHAGRIKDQEEREEVQKDEEETKGNPKTSPRLLGLIRLPNHCSRLSGHLKNDEKYRPRRPPIVASGVVFRR